MTGCQQLLYVFWHVCRAQLLAFNYELIPNSTTSSELGWPYRAKGKGDGREGRRELHIGLWNQQTGVWCTGRTTQLEEMSFTAGWEFITENYVCPPNDRILEIPGTYWLVRLRKSPDQTCTSWWIACPIGYYGAHVSGMHSLGTSSPHQTGQGAMKLAISALVGMFQLQIWPSKWPPAFVCSLLPIWTSLHDYSFSAPAQSQIGMPSYRCF